MEENKTNTENNKLSYEQLEKIALQLQQKALQAEARLKAINMTVMRIDYLFKVIDNANTFPKEFVDKCIDEVISLLEVKEIKEEADSPVDSTKE